MRRFGLVIVLVALVLLGAGVLRVHPIALAQEATPAGDEMMEEGITNEPDQLRLKPVTPEQLFETPHRSPQRPLWTWSDDEWLPALRLPAYAPRQPRATGAVQPPLFALEEAGA